MPTSDLPASEFGKHLDEMTGELLPDDLLIALSITSGDVENIPAELLPYAHNEHKTSARVYGVVGAGLIVASILSDDKISGTLIGSYFLAMARNMQNRQRKIGLILSEQKTLNS